MYIDFLKPEILVLLFWIILFVLFFYYWISTFFRGAPFVPSDKKAVKQIKSIVLEIDPAKTKTIIELGAGTGRIGLSLAKEGYNVTLVEINPFLSLYLRVKKFLFYNKYKSVSISNANFFKEDLTKFDIFIAYLFPDSTQKIVKMISKQKNYPCFFITNTFSVKDKVPYKKLEKVLVYKL